MWKISDIIESYLKPHRFNQSFRDRVRNLVNSNPADWDLRVTRSAKSLLASVCFRETVIASVDSKDSLIYQPIGLYYAMFHMSVAMLRLNPRVAESLLSEIHHKILINTVFSQLVQPKFVEPSYHKLFLELKKLRESCNYQFGYRDNLLKEVTLGIGKTEGAFDQALQFIHQVLDACNSLGRFQAEIGDGFGDDILDTYLSTEHKDNVMQYLVTNGLSS